MEDVTKLHTEMMNKKQFIYRKLGMTLDFTLNVDNRDGMIAFKELLEAASKDVAAEIEKVAVKE